MRKVNLIVNTYEKTYKKVISQGFFPHIEEQNKYVFKKKILLINNVVSQEDMIARLQKIVNRGEIDEYYFVSDYIDSALKVTELTIKDLGRVRNYTNWALVAVTILKNDWLLHWDADIFLQKYMNWIEPSIRLMENDDRIFIANPNPDPDWVIQTIEPTHKLICGVIKLQNCNLRAS